MSESIGQIENRLLGGKVRGGTHGLNIDVAFLVEFFIGCVFNLLVSVYASVNGWDMTAEALVMVVANPTVLVCWKICETVDSCISKRSVRLQ